jgi:hypothetical protein
VAEIDNVNSYLIFYDVLSGSLGLWNCALSIRNSCLVLASMLEHTSQCWLKLIESRIRTLDGPLFGNVAPTYVSILCLHMHIILSTILWLLKCSGICEGLLDLLRWDDKGIVETDLVNTVIYLSPTNHVKISNL